MVIVFKQNPILVHLTEVVIRRFWAKVKVAGPNDHWLWLGASRPDEYGVMAIGGKSLKVHRVAWVIENKRDIQEGFIVDHTCNIKFCVNPKHLEEVTQTVNVDRYHEFINPTSHCRYGHGIEIGVPCKICNANRQRKWRAERYSSLGAST